MPAKTDAFTLTVRGADGVDVRYTFRAASRAEAEATARAQGWTVVPPASAPRAVAVAEPSPTSSLFIGDDVPAAATIATPPPAAPDVWSSMAAERAVVSRDRGPAPRADRIWKGPLYVVGLIPVSIGVRALLGVCPVPIVIVLGLAVGCCQLAFFLGGLYSLVALPFRARRHGWAPFRRDLVLFVIFGVPVYALAGLGIVAAALHR